MSKTKSKISVRSDTSRSISKTQQELPVPDNPLDELVVKIKRLQISDDDEQYYNINMSYFDQLIINSDVIGSPKWVNSIGNDIVGTMSYDPSDYEKISLFADNPIIVTARPGRTDSTSTLTTNESPLPVKSKNQSNTSNQKPNTSAKSETSIQYIDVCCCNIDIVPLFIDQEQMLFKKRLEPSIQPSEIFRKSWDNLPLLTLEISVIRNPLNQHHHEMLKSANYMKFTVIGTYNMFTPYNDSFQYTVATQIPLQNEQAYGTFIFGQGYKTPKRFKNESIIPSWETLRSRSENFTKHDVKLAVDLQHVVNDQHMDLHKYLKDDNDCSTIWASFHRTLFFGDVIPWFSDYIRAHLWPLEVQMTSDFIGYHFFGSLNLFRLLYPGENKVTIAVPLKWVTSESHMDGYHQLLNPIDKQSSISNKATKKSKSNEELNIRSVSTQMLEFTGADNNNAFVMVEVSLFMPLKMVVIPPTISNLEINTMLDEIENITETKIRRCTGRGHHKDWQNAVKVAVDCLRRVPYFGTTDICSFNRQLSESRTRVELFTSFWQEAAKYVNENFVLDQYIHSEDTYNEVLLISHACMIKEVEAALTKRPVENLNPILRAARHARQVQNLKHARRLYMQVLIDYPNDGNVWRELSTCMKDRNLEYANVCLQHALKLDFRHPLTLLSIGCMIMDENLEASEPFFEAILSLYPFYTTLWYCTYCYYFKREMFEMSSKIMDIILETKAAKINEKFPFNRTWEHELGDWWDQTPYLQDNNGFYDAADLLLRMRAFTLADVSISQAFLRDGESACYYHHLSLSCRLRGDLSGALCHLRLGRKKFGEISHLNSLEAECLFKLGDVLTSMAAFKRAGLSVGAYSILLSIPSREYPKSRSALVDLAGREPSAYAWMALAKDWIQHPEPSADKTQDAVEYVSACAIEALKCDRSFARAWALLGKLVPITDRRNYCKRMASMNGYRWQDDDVASKDDILSICCIDTKQLRECFCHLSFTG